LFQTPAITTLGGGLLNEPLQPGETEMSYSVKHIRIANGSQIPTDWGTPRVAKRKTAVMVREPMGIETFKKFWGTLTATPGDDLIIVQDSGEEYPIKKEIFEKTYKTVAAGRFRKVALSRLIQVPKGVVAVLATLEGDIEVMHPDYIVIGENGEVYANNVEWVKANLDFVD
jgi:hypothetical protein